jgi:methylated-DNA-[protein]-cysteine S-methyltransferase
MPPPDTRDYDAILVYPFATLGARMAAEHLTALEFLPPETPARGNRHALIAQLAAQLTAYMKDPAYRFDLPIQPGGSEFRRRVWRALLDIPAGSVRTYGDLARQLGSGARAVGQALGDNPLPIIVPCHRVVASDGGLGGFNHGRGGYSLDIKQWLLRHEGVL